MARAARRRADAILFVADVLHPLDRRAVERFLDGDMRHGCRGGRAVPMLFAWLKPDHVARADFIDGTALPLHPADARGDNQGLTKRMRVRGSPGAGFERDSRTANAALRRRSEERVDAHGPGEPVRRS